MAAGEQHHLEFGGSPVTTEFPGRLRYQAVDRIPILELSYTFDEEAARAIRYELVSSVGPERPFYHRHRFVVLDVRMVSSWKQDAAPFVTALRDRLLSIHGDLYVVANTDTPLQAGVTRYGSIEAAVDAAKTARRERRASLIGRA